MFTRVALQCELSVVMRATYSDVCVAFCECIFWCSLHGCLCVQTAHICDYTKIDSFATHCLRVCASVCVRWLFIILRWVSKRSLVHIYKMFMHSCHRKRWWAKNEVCVKYIELVQFGFICVNFLKNIRSLRYSLVEPKSCVLFFFAFAFSHFVKTQIAFKRTHQLHTIPYIHLILLDANFKFIAKPMWRQFEEEFFWKSLRVRKSICLFKKKEEEQK